MNENAILEQNRTRDDLVNKLNTYGKCLVARCTGFGKTTMMSKMIPSYSKVLYLYPTEVIRDSVDRFLHDSNCFVGEDGVMEKSCNVEFMTYSKLARLMNEEIHTGYDLIIADECHRMGASKTSDMLWKVLGKNPKAHFVGLLASPERTDTFDVEKEFFDNITVYKYTLSDAIRDGIIQKPNYCFASYGEVDLKNEDLERGLMMNNYVPTTKFISNSNVINLSEVVKLGCSSLKDTSSMRFIVFHSTLDRLREDSILVNNAFKEVFPNHVIKELEISSRTVETKDVKRLQELKCVPNQIILIHCIDMLNMGYHIKSLTGIVMMRSTKSNIIFSQQLGRILSFNDSQSKLVIDVADNLQRKAWCRVMDKECLNRLLLKKSSIIQELQNSEDNLRKKYLEACIDEIDNKINILQRRCSKYNKEDEYNRSNYTSALTPMDVTVIGGFADLSSVIKKVDLEPTLIKCKKAFISWCETKALREGRTFNSNSNSSMRKFLEESNLTLDRFIGLENDLDKGNALTDVPLRPFAQSFNVSVGCILEYVFGSILEV